MKLKHKKALIGALALAFTIGTTALYTSADAADLQVSTDKIKVFIGSVSSLNPFVSLKYNMEQKQTLQTFATEAPNQHSTALVTFDDYLTEAELAAALGSDVTLETVYIWAPGHTGRSIIDVNGRSAEEAVAQHFINLDIENWLADDPTNLAVYQYVQANYGYFAVEVTASNQALQALGGRDHVAGVELVYSEYAETRAAATGREISYICVPEKPDGAL